MSVHIKQTDTPIEESLCSKMTATKKPGTLLTRTLFLLIGGVLAGGIVNVLRPGGGIAWFYDWSAHLEARAVEEGIGLISAEDTLAFSASGEYLILDARTPAEYATGYIPGAMLLPYGDVDEAFPDIQLFLFPEQPVITYCSGLACDDALMLSMFLRDQGYTNVFLFAGGMEAWKRAGYPLEGAP